MAKSHDILHLAFGTGRTILENGGETYRAEETIDRIAVAYGMADPESFVVPTGIMASVTDPAGETHSLSRRVMHRTINLDKVARASALARRIERARPDPAGCLQELKDINAISGLPTGQAMALSGLIAGFFTLFFGGQLLELLVSMITGAAVFGVLAANRRAGFGDFLGNVMGGIVAALIPTLITQLLSDLYYQPVIMGAIMLLVPGISIVNAIRDTISGEILSGTTRAIEALVLSVGIALGTGAMLKLYFLFGRIPVPGEFEHRALLEPVYAAAATYGFARIFNVHRREAFVSALAGGLVWAAFLLVRHAGASQTVGLFCAALFAGMISEVLAKGLKKPVTLFMVPCMIPLVPGSNLYFTMVELTSGQYDYAWRQGMHALVMAGAIATGLAFSASLARIYGRVRRVW